MTDAVLKGGDLRLDPGDGMEPSKSSWLWLLKAAAVGALACYLFDLVTAGESDSLTHPLSDPPAWLLGGKLAVLGIIAIGVYRIEKLLTLLKVAVGVSLVLWLLAGDSLEIDVLARVQDGWPWFLLAQGAFSICILITVVRWRLLLGALQLELSFRDAVRLTMTGLFFNQFAPGGSGGDLVKAFYIARETPEARTEAVFSVFLDRILGLTGLMVLAAIALMVNFARLNEDPVVAGIGQVLSVVIVLVLLGGALVAWRGFWHIPFIARLHARLPGRQMLAKVAHALWTVRGKRRLLIFALGISVLNHGIIVLTHLFLARAMLGEFPPLGLYFFLVPVAQLAIALPLTPAGYGVGETAYDKLFARVGQSEGLELVLLLRLTWILWGLVGLVFYLRGRQAIDAAIEEGESAELARSVDPPE